MNGNEVARILAIRVNKAVLKFFTFEDGPIRKIISQSIEAVILIALIPTAAISIVEYTGRIALSHKIETTYNELNQEFAASDNQEGRKLYRNYRDEIRNTKDGLETLERSGTSREGGRTVPMLSTELSRVISSLALGGQINNNAYSLAAERPSTADAITAPITIWTQFVTKGVSTFPSDILLSIIAVCCGGVGSVIAGIRRKQEFTAIQDLVLGLSSGFVVYIVIRGGKYVFLLQQTEVPLNPYGVALAGILTGLFTERAYNLLAILVSMIERKIKQVCEEDNDNKKTDAIT